MKNSLLLGFVLFLIISIGFSTYLVQSPQVPGKFADELEEPIVDVANDVIIEDKTQDLVVTETVTLETPTESVVATTEAVTPTTTLDPTLEPTIEPTFEPTLLPTEPVVEPTLEPSLVPTTNPESKSCEGDVNGDGSVDFADVELIKANFGQTTCEIPGDIDNNCIVNIYDYGILLQNYACSKE